MVEAVISEHIESTPGVCGGKPRIAGHRIRVEDIAVWHEQQGLSPDEIVAQFPQITLADVYDALTSRRVYKQAFSHDLARSMILADSGSHFDPLLVQAFLDNEERFTSIREKFSENLLAVA